MSTILNIDISANAGSVSISRDGMVLGHIANSTQSEHASFLQPTIKKLCSDLNVSMKEIDAVAIGNGPGSYTGLRIGLASAKGICYTLGIPLITINNLLIMAAAAKNELGIHQSDSLLCPMIDARRMEVFTAVYDYDLKEIISPCAMVMNADALVEILKFQKVVFFGNGSAKIQGLIGHTNAIFMQEPKTINALAELGHYDYQNKRFADLAYCEPYYLKEFFNG